MNHPGWGAGDLFSIATGLFVLTLCLCLRPAHRTIPAASVALANGLSLGPLLLIILDPIAQVTGLSGSLLEIVLSQGRVTLWWAAVVASLYVSRDLF
jgi:hypothetical protein